MSSATASRILKDSTAVTSQILRLSCLLRPLARVILRPHRVTARRPFAFAQRQRLRSVACLPRRTLLRLSPRVVANHAGAVVGGTLRPERRGPTLRDRVWPTARQEVESIYLRRVTAERRSSAPAVALAAIRTLATILAAPPLRLHAHPVLRIGASATAQTVLDYSLRTKPTATSASHFI